MNNSNDKFNEELTKLYPQLKEDLGLVFLQEQLKILGIDTVISEFEGYKGLTFQLFDKDSIIDQIKMDWFPTKIHCSKRNSWYDKNSLFKVGIYVLELPKLDENYSQEIADNEFYTHLQVEGNSAKEILDSALTFISQKYGLDFDINPTRN